MRQEADTILDIVCNHLQSTRRIWLSLDNLILIVLLEFNDKTVSLGASQLTI